jgi:hypothetical protein
MGNSQSVEEQEFLHTADRPRGYICSATVISAEKS